MDRELSERGWLALSCDRDGTIVSVLRDDHGFAILPGTGARLPDLVDPGSIAKAEALIAALRERDHVVGWHLNIPSDDTARPMYFAGSASADSLLILAAPDARGVTELFDDVSNANVGLSQALRALVSEQREGITAAMHRDNRLYEELSRLNNELINRERELARKTAALERISAEKTRMTAIAAHDLRNPLTVIQSYAALLKLEMNLGEEAKLYADEIERSARFMSELVEEMLDTSRVESGHIDLDLQDLDLVNAARHASTINRIRAERKQISIAFDQQIERAVICADPVKLRQIVNNLVVNAIKFSPAGTTVTIRVRGYDDRAVVEVEDQGVGIPSDKLDTIFEPFKTLGPTGTAGEKSTGLGLAIVKQLVNLHHATVDVESEEGRGSLFRVSFPVKR